MRREVRIQDSRAWEGEVRGVNDCREPAEAGYGRLGGANCTGV